MITSADVINSALNRLQTESLALHTETNTLNARLQEISKRQQEIRVEHEIFSTYTGRSEVHGRSGVAHMGIEDCIKNIMLSAGKPVRIGYIIDELEKFGFTWNRYTSAYNRLMMVDVLEKVPQTHGYYQLLR